MFKLQDGRDKFYQWDSDRKLIVEDPQITEVHFSNRTDDYSLVVKTYVENGITLANVPNILLQNSWRIHVYAVDGNYTKHEKCYEIVARTKPSDYVYTETEIINWQYIKTQLDSKADVLDLEKVEADLDNKKVDKVTGKGLSTNDYTDTDKVEVAKVKDKVGFTDYATDTKAGVVKIESIKGIKVDETGEIGLNVPNETAIAQRLPSNGNLPITIGNLDYAVRSVHPITSNSIPDTLAVNTIYRLSEIETLTLNLPFNDSIGANGNFIQVDFYSGKTRTNLTITSAGGLSDIDLSPEANTMYSLYFDWGLVYCHTTEAGAVLQEPGWRFSYAEYPHKEV